MNLYGGGAVLSVSGCESKYEIEFVPELLNTDMLKDRVNEAIRTSGLDVALRTEYLAKGVLVLMIGVIKVANAIPSLAKKIINIINQCVA